MYTDTKQTMKTVAKCLAYQIVMQNRVFKSLPPDTIRKQGIDNYIPLIKNIINLSKWVDYNRSELIEKSYDDYVFVFGVCSKFEQLGKSNAFDREFVSEFFDFEPLALYYLQNYG